MADYLGNDTLGIVSMVATGEVDQMGEDVTAPAVVASIFGCIFEPLDRGPIEELTATVTAQERAWAWLPYIEGQTTGLTNAQYIQPQRPDALAQRNYKIVGLPEIEYGMDGLPDHVFITCEWQGG